MTTEPTDAQLLAAHVAGLGVGYLPPALAEAGAAQGAAVIRRPAGTPPPDGRPKSSPPPKGAAV